MKCPTCEFLNRDAAVFCMHCGERLATKCSQCGRLFQPEAKFCDECGIDLKDVSGPEKPGVRTVSAEEMMRRWTEEGFAPAPGEHTLSSCVQQFEKILIVEALKETGGNRSAAAKLLGLTRPTLHSKIQKYEIERVFP